MRKITHIAIHCSDSPDSADEIGLTEIRNWHLQRGWSDIGYHWVIDKKGDIWAGRKETIPGAGVKGHNKHTIHLCWVGRDICNIDQWAALVEKTAETALVHGVLLENILGHCEFPGVSKTCPNLNMTKFRNAVEQKLKGWANG